MGKICHIPCRILGIFIDFGKAYDMIARHGIWQMLRVHGVGGKLLKAVQSFYIDSIAFVPVEMM